MIKKLVRISCKKATFLASKKAERKITLLQQTQLQAHVMICTGCKRFVEQTNFMESAMERPDDSHNIIGLSAEKKEKIKTLMVDAD